MGFGFSRQSSDGSQAAVNLSHCLRITEANASSRDQANLKRLNYQLMKKFLAIFLLVLLPLQYSWAAMASYCEHETSVTAKHPGHHTHDHASIDQQESSKNAPQSAGMDHDCATCHMGCAAALVNYLNTISAAVSDDHPLHPQVIVSQLSRERPERPNWPVLA